uniref:Uncharacterized protein n=1 Tax=Arundo donax TaxID=35708 RepID=A0A0A9G473_ARUDO
MVMHRLGGPRRHLRCLGNWRLLGLSLMQPPWLGLFLPLHRWAAWSWLGGLEPMLTGRGLKGMRRFLQH